MVLNGIKWVFFLSIISILTSNTALQKLHTWQCSQCLLYTVFLWFVVIFNTQDGQKTESCVMRAKLKDLERVTVQKRSLWGARVASLGMWGTVMWGKDWSCPRWPWLPQLEAVAWWMSQRQVLAQHKEGHRAMSVNCTSSRKYSSRGLHSHLTRTWSW